ncbi:MAG: EamA family transporter [Candidatus Rokuibacteriota bacterium]|nr:MAG: EamA family transporter [Candidatus Rokubacteria bacterium]
MPLAALLLVLGAAVCHSAWNLLVKTDARRLEIQSGALVVGVVLCSPALLIHPLTEVSRSAWAAILLSGVFETAYVFALTAAYGAGDLSLVYPVARGTPPLLVVPLAVVLLGERPSAQGLAGIGLVVVGIYASHAGLVGGRPATRANGRALGLALLTGVFTAGYSLVNKLGVGLVPVPLYAFLVFGVDAALIHVVRWVRGGLTPPLGRDAPRGRTVAVGVLMMAAYLAVLAAMTMAPVSYVVAAREVSVVVTAALGALILHEPHSAARITGAAVIFAGLVVIALAH